MDFLYGISFMASLIYIFAMLFMFYWLILGKTRKQLQLAVNAAKISLAMACINLFCHLVLGDGAMALLDLIKILGPMVNLWSLGIKMDALPMTEAERFEAEALRDLRKL